MWQTLVTNSQGKGAFLERMKLYPGALSAKVSLLACCMFRCKACWRQMKAKRTGKGDPLQIPQQSAFVHPPQVTAVSACHVTESDGLWSTSPMLSLNVWRVWSVVRVQNLMDMAGRLRTPHLELPNLCSCWIHCLLMYVHPYTLFLWVRHICEWESTFPFFFPFL